MRCPDCNKFVGYDEPEVDVTSTTFDGVSAFDVDFEVRLNCAECGTELKSGSDSVSLDAEFTASEEKPDATEEVCPGHEDGHEFGEPDDAGCVPNVRTEGRGRGLKTFYGGEFECETKCEHCGGTMKATGVGDIQASALDES